MAGKKENRLFKIMADFLPEIALAKIINSQSQAEDSKPKSKEQPHIVAGGIFNQSEEVMWELACNELTKEEALSLNKFLKILKPEQTDRLQTLVGHMYVAETKDKDGHTIKGSTPFLLRFNALSEEQKIEYCQNLGGILESDFRRDLKRFTNWLKQNEAQILGILNKIHNSKTTSYHGIFGELTEMVNKLAVRFRLSKKTLCGIAAAAATAILLSLILTLCNWS